MQIAMTIIHIIISLILIVFVLLQNSKEGGFSTTFMGGQEDNDRPRAKTLDDILSKWTIVVGILFVISTIILSFIF